MPRTRIKICGLTTVEDAAAAVEHGADAIGLVFAPSSPRRVSLDRAAEIVASLPPFVTAVGVFQLSGKGVDADFEQWKTLSPWAQLHGDEDERVARQASRGRRLIKGFRFSSSAVRQWAGCTHVEMLLVEGSRPGSGQAWDFTSLAAMRDEIRKPIALAGGLNIDNVAEAIRAVRPFAVDVSTGVESAPGRKDAAMIRAFCQAVREADASIDA